MSILNLPGIGDSGPGHWQALWEEKDSRFARVKQRDWYKPICSEWVDTLQKAVDAAGPKPILVAHSLGCLLVAHWALVSKTEIGGALLVAPADPHGIFFPQDAIGFSPVPTKPFVFRSVVVSSLDDPFAEAGFAEHCASDWGSRLVSAGPAGHINAESNLGYWPFGFALLEELIGGE